MCKGMCIGYVYLQGSVCIGYVYVFGMCIGYVYVQGDVYRVCLCARVCV